MARKLKLIQMQDMQKIPDVLHSFLLVDNGKMQLAMVAYLWQRANG